jgi:RimJ/RimL family protein N-acetyltransferase
LTPVFFHKTPAFLLMSEIKTERLLLKNYAERDKENLIALLTDGQVMKHVDTGVFTIEKAEALWKKLVEVFYPQGIDAIYAVFAGDNGRYIGHASIRPRPTKTEDWEIGYILKTEEWGKGYATEIAQSLIKYGFDELNLTQVVATIDDDNLNSIKVAEKVGMSFSHYEYDKQGRFSVYAISAP